MFMKDLLFSHPVLMVRNALVCKKVDSYSSALEFAKDNRACVIDYVGEMEFYPNERVLRPQLPQRFFFINSKADNILKKHRNLGPCRFFSFVQDNEFSLSLGSLSSSIFKTASISEMLHEYFQHLDEFRVMQINLAKTHQKKYLTFSEYLLSPNEAMQKTEDKHKFAQIMQNNDLVFLYHRKYDGIFTLPKGNTHFVSAEAMYSKWMLR